jgi:quercetin dioxygenase-like cupin family protein
LGRVVDVKVCRYGDLKKKDDRPGMCAAIVHGAGLTVSHWKIERGAALQRHSHPHAQISYVVSGSMRFHCEGSEPFAVAEGDFVIFGPNEAHGGEALEDCVVIDAFSPAREDFKRELGWAD